jgi:hypothetical protein
MKKWRVSHLVAALALPLLFTGCATLGGPAADLGLAGAGGVAGYHLSDHKVGGAAAGAVVGYAASRIAQSRVKAEVSDAEQSGYDRAMNQSVKQQYWIIQAQQRAKTEPAPSEAKLVPVVIPETVVNGVKTAAHLEYLRVP